MTLCSIISPRLVKAGATIRPIVPYSVRIVIRPNTATASAEIIENSIGLEGLVMADSDKFPTDFIPVSRPLIKELGYEAAYIFGVIWNYCQMEKGFCDAAHQTIADRADMSRKSVIKYIEKLTKAGYIEDLTPDVRNAPHRLCTKKGVQILHSKEHTIKEERPIEEPERCEEIAQQEPVGMQNLPSRYAEIAQLGMQNLHKNRKSQETDSREILSKDNSGSSPPSDSIPESESIPEENLLPDTPEALSLFEKINHNRKLKNRGPMKEFKSREQKQKCLAAMGRLPPKELEKSITKGLEKGLTDITSLINWISRWELPKNGATNNGTQGKYVNPSSGNRPEPTAREIEQNAKITARIQSISRTGSNST